jgi:hypothetical protein
MHGRDVHVEPQARIKRPSSPPRRRQAPMHGRDVGGRGGDLPRGGAGPREHRAPCCPPREGSRGCGTDPPPAPPISVRFRGPSRQGGSAPPDPTRGDRHPPISVPSDEGGRHPPISARMISRGVLDGRARGLDPVMNAQQWILPKRRVLVPGPRAKIQGAKTPRPQRPRPAASSAWGCPAWDAAVVVLPDRGGQRQLVATTEAGGQAPRGVPGVA